MLILKGAGYVDSKRGTGGGFFLIKHPQEITLGEIVRLMKGVPESSRRSNKENKEEVSIVLEKIWNEVTQAVDNIIDTITLWDIFQRKEELREQRTGYTYQI
jgi:Rrf2 family protein